jgi:hypothetical protein
LSLDDKKRAGRLPYRGEMCPRPRSTPSPTDRRFPSKVPFVVHLLVNILLAAVSNFPQRSSAMTVVVQKQPVGGEGEETGQSSKTLQSPILHRQVNWSPGEVVGGSGHYLYLDGSRKVFDASGGAAVSCLGHGNARVAGAMAEQTLAGTPYLASIFWTSNSVEALGRELVDSTKGQMAKAYLVCSGMVPEILRSTLLLTC